MNRGLIPSFLSFLMAAAGAGAAWAADCGDTAGPGGTRVACACGDTVVTNTSLRAGDPVTTGCAGLGLRIGADHITLNCNGRQITGDETDAGIRLEGRTGVTVRTCAINAFTTGLELSGSSGNRLLANTISFGFVGIQLQADSNENRVESNRVLRPFGDGINLLSARDNVIVTNTLDGGDIGGDGIDLDGPATGNTVRGNRITRFPGSGIELDRGGGNLVTENHSSDNGIGIRVATLDANTIARNTTDGNDAEGLDICCQGHQIDRNRARRNGANGITVTGHANAVTRNTTDGNVGSGIGLDGDDNTVDQNRGRENGLSGLEVGFGNRNNITRNVFDDNAEDGIFVGGDDSTVDGNRGQNNGDDGLEIVGLGNTVSNNTFDRNADWGICAGAGNADGGGNRAQGNGGGQIAFGC